MRVTIRGEALGKMKPAEVNQFIDWAKVAQVRTTFDPQIIGYPRCAMLITEDDDGPVSFLPCQAVLMAEVFIPRPESSTRQKTKSLMLIDDGLIKLGRSMNAGDVYLYVPDGELDYIGQLQRKGWQEVEGVRLFKKRTGVKVLTS